jgi:hypothetical protein
MRFLGRKWKKKNNSKTKAIKSIASPFGPLAYFVGVKPKSETKKRQPATAKTTTRTKADPPPSAKEDN